MPSCPLDVSPFRAGNVARSSRLCAPRSWWMPRATPPRSKAANLVEDGDALVVATSGTTGEPKGVVLTHDAVRASALATSARLGVDPVPGPLARLPAALARRRPLGRDEGARDGHACGDPAPFHRGGGHGGGPRRGATLVCLVPAALARLGPEGARLFRTIVVGRPASHRPTRPATS